MTGAASTLAEQPDVYTQCSKCETVFRLSAEALRAAGGQVRCGRCGEVFNALARLAEDATAFPSGESSLESETRADAILHSVEPVSTATAPAQEGDEIAQLKVLDTVDAMDAVDEEVDLDASLEFTLPPGELDRIFIETSPTPLQLLAASVKPSPAQSGQAALATRVAEPKQTGPGPAAPEPVASVPAAPVPAAPVPAVPLPAAPLPAASILEPGMPLRNTPPQIERRVHVPAAKIPGLTVSEDIRQEMLAGYQRAELPEINPPRRQLPFAVWVSAAVTLALLLVFQVYQTNEGWMSVHAPLLNNGGNAAATLSTYQLRQWGVTGDPGANGTLRVRASIMNAAAQLQPYPLLRVTLADRFGTRVGAREFEPAEYLGKAPARMLAPGERVDATLNILDPGKDAEGFEIDVCIRSAEKKIICAADATAAGAGAAQAAAAAARQSK
jgi:predicted Zn finger-like uncharacterized protein